MIKEVADLFASLQSVHMQYEKAMANVPEELMVKKPHESMNTLASILEHVAIAERKFMSILANDRLDIDAFATFKKQAWDVQAIRSDWADVLNYSRSVLEQLTESQLDEHAFKMGERDLNKRQLLILTLSHASHHHGQLPLLKKLLGIE